MRLRLQSNAYVFDWAGEDGIGDAGEGAGGIELCVGELRGVRSDNVTAFEPAARGVEGAELNGDTGANAD